MIFFMIFLKFCSEIFGLKFLQKFVFQTFFLQNLFRFFLRIFQKVFFSGSFDTNGSTVDLFFPEMGGGESLMYALYSMVCDGIQWFSMVVNGI